MKTPVLKTTTMAVMMTIIVMKNSAEVVEVKASTGESIVLKSGLQNEQRYEARWTHKNLLVQSGRTSECQDGGRCELLAGGSLMLRHVTRQCAGAYKLELFDSRGKLMNVKEFLLRVDDSSRSSAGRYAAICCSLLALLVFVAVFILRRKGMKRCPMSGQSGQTDNVYVEMHRSKISPKEEERKDVSSHPAVSSETDVYV